jgi:hypothetical protein
MPEAKDKKNAIKLSVAICGKLQAIRRYVLLPGANWHNFPVVLPPTKSFCFSKCFLLSVVWPPCPRRRHLDLLQPRRLPQPALRAHRDIPDAGASDGGQRRTHRCRQRHRMRRHSHGEQMRRCPGE